MIEEYQKKLAKKMNIHLNNIFEKGTDAYDNAQLLITLTIIEVKPLLEKFRGDVDIINDKIKDEDQD